MSRLLMVRHGDTELNNTEKWYGYSDVRLSAAGFRQAERLRDRLAVEKIDAIYSSDLSRASVTAEVVASRHSLGVVICNELREINLGEFERLTFAEISRLYPEVARLWTERSMKLCAPGGESLDEFNKRVSRFLGRLEKHNPGETVLIVAHSGSLRLLICNLLGIGLQHWWQVRLDLASLSIMETYPEGTILSLLNDVSHLAQV